DLVRIYTHAGFRCVQASAETGEGVEALRDLIRGKLAAFTGNSGVGKSLWFASCPMIRCLKKPSSTAIPCAVACGNWPT
ncbi:MAG: GTPase RsgA, partial [Clostridia bacterium]|nr:GTPase RsgA [Clostridia bacterium]